MLGEVLVAHGEGGCQGGELFALDGVNLKQVAPEQLLDAGAHVGALHHRVELAGGLGRGLHLNDQGLVAGGAHNGALGQGACQGQRHDQSEQKGK